ncbi:Hypothetical predicted protein [Octopus vulgaris]|uniref:Uncharacterized protein n=1 Tax=Octopus vulgaris TaxID=6645 RepID=A0AA36B9G6_OCTVU|nr:Hypothetical predicted protein [Octopus vulgaris]
MLGEESYQFFRQERVESDVPSKTFHDKMTKMKLKTFSYIRKKPRIQGHAKDVVLKADRDLFSYMILVTESRKLHMADVLAHPLGPLLIALANDDGTLHKTTKHSYIESWRRMLPQQKFFQVRTIIGEMSLKEVTRRTFSTKEPRNIVLMLALMFTRNIHKNTQWINRVLETGIEFRSILPGHTIQ